MGTMFERDADIRRFALNLWANHIETGDVRLSLADAQARNAAFRASEALKLPDLSDDQRRLVERIRRLAAAER